MRYLNQSGYYSNIIKVSLHYLIYVCWVAKVWEKLFYVKNHWNRIVKHALGTGSIKNDSLKPWIFITVLTKAEFKCWIFKSIEYQINVKKIVFIASFVRSSGILAPSHTDMVMWTFKTVSCSQFHQHFTSSFCTNVQVLKN